MSKNHIPSQAELDRQVAQQNEEALHGKAIEVGYSLAQVALRNYHPRTNEADILSHKVNGVDVPWAEGAPRPINVIADETAEFVTRFAENIRKGFLKTYEKNVNSIDAKYAKTEGNA